MKKINTIYNRQIVKIILSNFTLANFISASFTIISVAIFKYLYYVEFFSGYTYPLNDIALVLLSWLVNSRVISLLSDYWGIKGINSYLTVFNFGLDKIKGGVSSYEEVKWNKYSNPMQSSENVDKGKGIDLGEDLPLDKGKGKEVEPTLAPLGFTWSQVFPGVDPASVFFPPKINPGPGFNVPGGEVPITDEICKHIDYNTHFLKQFKNMDLNTAIQQRNAYLANSKLINGRLAFAQDALTKVPVNPTNDYDIRLRNQILRDLERMVNEKIRLEARATLIGSRIDFIESRIKKN